MEWLIGCSIHDIREKIVGFELTKGTIIYLKESIYTGRRNKNGNLIIYDCRVLFFNFDMNGQLIALIDQMMN